MSVSRRFLALALMLALVFALAGCDGGVTAKVDYDFSADGSFTQSVDLRGVQLDDTQVANLKDAGWSVKQSNAGFTAKSVFSSAGAYEKPASALYTALDEVFVRDAGYDPGMTTEVSVRHVVTDMLLVEKHEVEVQMPAFDLSPTECPTCNGDGYSDCPDCDGGEVTCSDCGGTGQYQGWFGPEECWNCSGTGRVQCSTCSGSGVAGMIECPDCGGTGDAPEWIKTAYEDGVSGSRLDVAIAMPGFTVNSAENSSPWKLKGTDIEAADTFAATSYVVNWLYAGIAAAVLLGLLALAVWLLVRGVKRSLGRKGAVAPVAVPVAVPAAAPVAVPVAAPAAQEAAPGTACPGCGAPVNADARFCRSCGAKLGNGDD